MTIIRQPAYLASKSYTILNLSKSMKRLFSRLIWIKSIMHSESERDKVYGNLEY
jgi:hypothetical protein